MARAFTLSDGTTTINLLDPDGFQATSLGTKSMSADANVPAGHLRYVETYNLIVYSSDHDDAASQLKSIFGLLRDAHLYQTTSWQNVPVYLTAQTSGETNARYAMVYGSPSIVTPDVFAIPFETSNMLEGFAITVIRGVWRSGIPGATPTAATLTATSAPNDAAVMPVANFYDDVDLTSIFNSGPESTDFSTDMSGAQAVTLYGATYDSNWEVFAGSSDGPIHNLCMTLAQDREGGNELVLTYTTDAYAQQSTNTGFVPQSKSSDFLTTTDGLLGFRAVTLRHGGDAAYTARTATAVAVNGETGYWIQLQPDGTPDTDAPAITTTDGIYTQNKPYIEFDSDTLKGDIPPMVNLRLWNAGQHPANASSDARAWNVSKVIIGAKTAPGTFSSHLNCSGAGLPANWTVAYDTDTTGNAESSNADANTPGGFYAACTFAASTQKTRVQFIGDDLMDSYRGEYKAFLRAEQVAGTDGDVSVALQIRMGSTDAGMPARLGELVDLSTHDKGYEIVDLGKFSIPFLETADTDYDDVDILFEVQAVQNTAGATIRFSDLILIPVDEWSIVLDDPISDNNLGTSAMWGNQYLEYDSGVLGHKAGKYHLEAGAATSFPAENWFYGGRPFSVEPGLATRVYFLMGHYHPDFGWGVEPLMSDPSSLIAVELRSQALYLSLRGAD